MNSRYIIEGNVLFYGQNISEIIKEIRKELNINCNNLQYNENFKVYINIMNNTINEYVFTKSMKSNVIDYIINNQLEKNQNSLNLETNKKYVIFHNFDFVNKKYFKQFKILFSKLSDTRFIFTSVKQVSFLQSFFLTLFIKPIEKDYHLDFENSLLNDCDNIITHIYKSYNEINFFTIRTMLYNLLFCCNDVSRLLKKISESAMKEKPERSSSIIKFASQVDDMMLSGNKDIIYLEHFILLLINNDNS